MTHENNQLWTKTYSGLLALKGISSGELYAQIWTSTMFDRVELTVYRTCDDLVDYVIIQKVLYLDNDIKEDIEEIETKVNKAITEVLGNEPL